MSWWEIVGWTGSVLVVVSLMVPSVRRFRILNLTGSLIATIYNVFFEIWPYAAMNGAIVLINIYWLWRLSQQGESEERGYSVVAVNDDNSIVQRFLSRNGASISAAYPQFTKDALIGTRSFLIMHDEEIIGLFAVRLGEDAKANVVVDYVTERFRNFTPGKFIYTNHKLFADLGVRTLLLPANDTSDVAYFRKQGFDGDIVLTKSF
ncbi:hypothetical protein JOD55_000210 [Arcanobacterium pluranimalium]|uniref:hypothetical protein n=1 Tax=Arcanobacterium pluranimalium TaxID=108028 RepID=UPI00195C9F87|nr:hypothetical protein [Arcanobacterium pluranimalium]MBM7824383.1 hypothetical protein [Arcanobacterium pluranimalium]